MRIKQYAIFASMFMLAGTMNSCNNDSKGIQEAFGIESRYDDFRDSKTWGKVVSKEIPVAAFSGIDLQGCADVDFYQDDEVSVVITGNEKALALYEVSVEKDMLTVRASEQRRFTNHPEVLIEVHAPAIWKIRNVGTGDVDLKNTVALEGDLMVDADGTGDVDIDYIKCHKLSVRQTGTGDVDVKRGKCNVIDIESTGTGDVDIDAKATTVKTIVSGTGDADLKVNCETLDITANGTGTVEAKGKCGTLTKCCNGLGKIRTKDLRATKVNIID